jgi:cytochrome oxidase Cu insertion factor (SCO1/SenC/PrrC family)
MKTNLTLVVVFLLVWPYSGYFTVVNAVQEKSQIVKSVRYECPMHPEVTSTRRGRCRKCGMALRRKKTETNPAGQRDASLKPQVDPAVLRKVPDVMVSDQNGRRLRFQSDLIAGKVVAINFIFTTCTAICPVLTASFRRVQQELGEENRDVQLISVSVDPTTDTPERLRDFAAKFKAGPGWTFVTGDKSEIDSILQALGVAVANKNDHTPMVLIGNDATGYWTRAYGLISPVAMAKLITDAKKGVVSRDERPASLKPR